MRMWMVDPKIMCRKHLLGEHVEIHMLVGHIKKKRSISGYVKNNCIEVSMRHERHMALVKEMERRGYNHKSRLNYVNTGYLSDKDYYSKVDKEASLQELINRCPECEKRFLSKICFDCEKPIDECTCCIDGNCNKCGACK